jgi:DNA-binding Xre family transcriptional regulator
MTYESTLPRTILPELLAECQEQLHKTDEQIAKEVGFTQTNVYTMVKQGTLKMPIDKVQALATAIDCPVSDLLRIVLRDTMPDVLATIEKIWAPLDLTANEKKLIESYRYLAKGRDVVPLVMDGQSIIALVTA